MEDRILTRMISYFGSDVRRINHALKVYAFARVIGSELKGNDHECLILAAILHDIGIRNAELKYQSSAGEYQELEGPPVAREILTEERVPGRVIDRVCFLVGNHHSYGKIDGADFQALVEADFLVNFYEDHLPAAAVRTIAGKYFKTPAGCRMAAAMYRGEE